MYILVINIDFNKGWLIFKSIWQTFFALQICGYLQKKLKIFEKFKEIILYDESSLEKDWNVISCDPLRTVPNLNLLQIKAEKDIFNILQKDF